MQLIGGKPVYSASDLVGFLACERLTALDQAAMLRLIPNPRRYDAELEVLRKRGFEHEWRYRDLLVSQGKRVIEISIPTWDESYEERLVEAAFETECAMADGWDVIYQGTFFDRDEGGRDGRGRGWRGHPDFLLRVDDERQPSRFGPYHYQVADTKLARKAKASAVLQVCSYIDHLENAQRVLPRYMHIVLGGKQPREEILRVDDFMAYYRSVRARFDAAVAAEIPLLEAAPEPCDHCDVCRWDEHCIKRRRDVDHLSLVAGITSRQRQALSERSIATLAALGSTSGPFQPALPGTSAAAAIRTREQARIQLQGRLDGANLHELLEPIEPNKGLASLPPPSPGDLFFDIEGDPYAFDEGLDYLFGILEPARVEADGAPVFHALWSRQDDQTFTLEAEKRAFEQLIDLFMDRLDADPAMHIYHYAPYEPTALKRLMSRYGTREDEVDRLLRGGVLVDLYRTVRQGLRASVESYSIKKLEPFYGFNREVELRDATSSIVAFEQWLQLGAEDQLEVDLLDKIVRYNRDDVVSTWKLRDWLEARRDDLLASGADVPRPQPTDGAPSVTLGAALLRVMSCVEQLTADVPLVTAERTPEQQARWLLAQLLSWHRREEKSTWWRFYHLMRELTDEERLEEKGPLAGLEPLGVVEEVARSNIHRYGFPQQEHDFQVGDEAHDPATDKSAGTVHAIGESDSTIDLKRGKASTAPDPVSLVPLRRVDSSVLQDSLLRLGEWVAANGIDAVGPNRAARDLLLRANPRIAYLPSGERLQEPDQPSLETAIRLVGNLAESILPIQGPPGAGKTFIGSHMIAQLIKDGRRVGITANSHKVIGNLLGAVLKAAEEACVEIHAVQKAEDDDAVDDPAVKRAATNADVLSALADESTNLIAGTAWLWARPDMAGAVDVLFVDEAGQMCLANAVAIAQAAGSMVLLGDPLQLDQPIQGVHPPGVAVSALKHLLGDEATMPPDRGLFLAETWRMHPELCGFTSVAFYDRRLTAQADLSAQRVLLPPPLQETIGGSAEGTGARLIPVEHASNDSESAEEATAIAKMAFELVESGATWIDHKGVERPIGWSDVLIVAAYNAQVAAIRSKLPPEARIGTVDKFQGQEAPISFYSMASSSAEDAPRGMTFLYNRNRLNVATSRARCLAFIVCSPDLLRVRVRTVPEMRLANTLCLFAEHANRSS